MPLYFIRIYFLTTEIFTRSNVLFHQSSYKEVILHFKLLYLEYPVNCIVHSLIQFPKLWTKRPREKEPEVFLDEI